MALSSVLRKAAARVVPLAVRTVAGSERGLHYTHVFSSILPAVGRSSGVLLRRQFPGSLFSYSTKGKSDEALLKVIESEIQCAVESQEEQAEDTPPEFPFKIEDQPGQRIVTLHREYQGEDITVEVHMPALVTGEEDDRREDEDEDEDDETESPNSSSLPLVVRVAKGKKPVLEFGCTAYPDEVAIDSLSIRDPENSEDQIAYEGPDFGDLDENLQKAFHKYLEIRGIRPSTTNFLHGYMVDKDGREFLTWLKNLQEFVQA